MGAETTGSPDDKEPSTVTLASLPTLNVYVAFGATDLLMANQNPLPPFDTTGYWTDISVYVQDLQTKSGKQHYLDRVEASSLDLTLNNRTGYFWVSPHNLVIRLPIAVTATWDGTTYPVFFGFTDSIQEQLIDQLNSELRVTCSDFIKYLSLRYMASENFWPTYANTSNTANWYRLDTTPSATVTYGQALSSTSVKYNAVNNFSVGNIVTISGLAGGPPLLNFDDVTVSAATPTTFTVSGVSTTSGTTSQGTGVAYLTTATDLVGGANGTLQGLVSFQQHGAMVYDTDNCVDLANGGSVGTGYLQIPAVTGVGSIDFWILGQGMSYQHIFDFVTSIDTFTVYVTETGNLKAIGNSTGYSATADDYPISDGYWHHIGIVPDASGHLNLYADNELYPFSSGASAMTTFDSTSTFNIGRKGSTPTATNLLPLAALLDEVVIGKAGITYGEIQNRFVAGTLLQIGAPATAVPLPGTSSTQVKSGDRIAEILVLAGFGYISGGSITLNSSPGIYYINNGGLPWTLGASGNGYTYVEPYYWDSPVTASTALDLILQVCDTDIGIFYQQPDGAFQFHNQNFYGTWTWTPSTSSGAWAVNSYSPTGYHNWTDDGTGTPYYGPSTQIVWDDADLWTLVKVTPQSGTPQVYENDNSTTGVPRYGISVLEKSGTVHGSLSLALSTANYLGYLYKGPPLWRVNQVELRAETNNGYYIPAMFSCKIGDVVALTRVMPQTSSLYQNFVVESVSHDFRADPGQWHTTFILDPYPVRA